MDISTKGSGSGFFADSSLDGLKFGKKIYFEDVGIGVSTKSGGGSSSISTSEGFPVSSPAPAIVRKVRRVTQPGQPPRCQVEGCEVDLSGTKAYYSRHKVCPVHSKFPKVIVAGLEQRFCQQCSRFHQLPEFDQGKRSCRRRLAGHNARRRKPQPGSLLSPRYARLSSSPQEDSSRVAGFLMDFSAYPRMPGTDAWPTIRAPNDGPTPTGKFLGQEWQANHPANIYSHGFHQYLQAPSPGGTVHSSSRIPPGECYAGVADSSCALSLLSNQSWDPRNHSSTTLSVNNLVSNEGSPMAQSTTLHGAVMNGFTGNTWNFKNDETGNNLCHNFGLGEVSSSNCHQFPGELELAHQQTNRQYMELPPSRAYDSSSTHQIDWSL